MNNWTELRAEGLQRWQTLLDEAENHRRVKRATAQSGLLTWLRHQLKPETKQSRMGPLRPVKARE